MRQRADVLRKHTADDVGLREGGAVAVGLPCGRNSIGAVIAADAALTEFRQVDVVSNKQGQNVGLNLLVLGDDGLQLFVKPVDICGSSGNAAPGIGDHIALPCRHGERLSWTGYSLEDKVVVGVGLDAAPEIAALVGVLVLGLAQV